MNSGKKFDVVLMNPPYAAGLHMKFLYKTFDIINDKTGKLVTIQPANRAFTDIQKAKKFHQEITNNNIKLHDVEINTFAKEFGIGIRDVMMILTVDQTNNGEIKCNIFGEESYKDNSYDINLIGDIDVINSIDNKIKERGLNTIDEHFFLGKTEKFEKLNIGENAAYLRNSGDIMTFNGYNSKADWIKDELHNVEYYGYITSLYVHKNKNEIVRTPEFQNKMAHPNGWIFYDKEQTYEENKQKLENFKYFIKNSNLAHYLNFVHPCICNHKFIPFFTEKFETDNDIYVYFDLNDKEIELIEKTAKNLTRESQFFKRYNGIYD
jgi:hypothetical protein